MKKKFIFLHVLTFYKGFKKGFVENMSKKWNIICGYTKIMNGLSERKKNQFAKVYW